MANKIDTLDVNGVIYDFSDKSAVPQEPGKGLITDAERQKLAGIAEGAQVNVIEGVRVNGADLTPSGKKVDVTVPTALSGLADDATHRLVTDTEKAAWNNKYDKPSTGIPKSDLASDVQSSLDKADSAIQEHQSLAAYVNGGSYNATTKKIELKHDSNVLAQIDATEFIKDGMVSNVEVTGGNLVISFNTDSGKEAISIPLTEVFNPANYYTKTATDELLAGKQPTIADLDTIRSGASAGASAYQKPSTGIPASDMAAGVQTSLGNADTALQQIADLLSGSLVPKLAEDLVSWNDEAAMQDDMQTLSVFTTGGDISIKSSVPAQLTEIAAKTDFSASALRASGFNLLRLKSNEGLTVAVGAGYYFPVPALPFGSVNTAEHPNGVLFTSRAGANLRPTVYFKRASAGVPTSVTDGAVCSYVDASWNGGTLRFYTTSEPGYIIVSGITWADTCAHIGWSKRYDEFISPTEASDAGHSVNISPVIAAMHSYGKMLTVGGSADRIRRVSATQVQWETECDKVKPAWTNTLQEDGETYLHTATISAMKADGAAQFETESQQLIVSGTSVSYTDASETAITDFVKYEKVTTSTGTANLATDFAVEDWGLIVLLDTVGEAYTTIAYAQGIPDNVRALVSARLSGQMSIVAQAFAEVYEGFAALLDALNGGGGIHRLTVPIVDAKEYRTFGIPNEVEGAGAPSASVIPKDWEKLCPGIAWSGIPLAPKMWYFDSVDNKWYRAKTTLTGAVADWVLLN